MIHDFGDGFFLRQATAADHGALLSICLKTGDAGKDATAREDDPDMLGLVYAVPYQVFEPDLAFIVEGPNGPAGYVLGVRDTAAFNKHLEAEWYPTLRESRTDPGPDKSAWHGSDWGRWLVHHPNFAVPAALAPYPSHGHIDLLPEAQGRGFGRHAMEHFQNRLKTLGSPGMYLGLDPKNRNALRFYEHLGFEILHDPTLRPSLIVAKRF
jgi:ribosomal protein S18 acetylase RimI-like enzyme